MSNFLRVFKLLPAVLSGRLPAATSGRGLVQSLGRWQKLTGDPKLEPPTVVDTPRPAERQGVSRSDRDLLEFLTCEIIEERRVQMQLEPPFQVDDFTVLMRGSEIELLKELPHECINIFFNVSKSVPRRADDSGVVCPVRSVPKFEVLIRRGHTLLSIYCTFLPTAFAESPASDKLEPLAEQPAKEPAEVFQIQEMSLYEHSWNECVYTIEASMIDDYLYDLLMNMLFEKGISHDFAIKISDLATAHEHTSYIEFLENLSKFAVGLPHPIK